MKTLFISIMAVLLFMSCKAFVVDEMKISNYHEEVYVLKMYMNNNFGKVGEARAAEVLQRWKKKFPESEFLWITYNANSVYIVANRKSILSLEEGKAE